jgi:hypothetical protein
MVPEIAKASIALPLPVLKEYDFILTPTKLAA